MLIQNHQSLSQRLGLIAAVVLLCPLLVQTESASASEHQHAIVKDLMRKDLIGAPGKEVDVSTVEYPPGVSSKPHRHDAQVFVYVLEGKVRMQTKGGPLETLGPGDTFYEGPSDIHMVSGNASKDEPAKFLALLIKDKGKPDVLSVAPGEAGAPSRSEEAPEQHAASAGPELMRRDLDGIPGKETVLSVIDSAPGHRSPPHRHNAQVFVYVLQGHLVMQVKGGPRTELAPGQMFYESPSDIHSVSANTSTTESGKFLAFLIKNKGAPGTQPVPPDQAQ